ncbi:ATPase involved in DNA repair [Synechococcus sp. PCC 7502]|uniref:AAA family ATPase n=1 Tax=Synechococcus sp. PCC 7502 TaxID=1173263 RepID=UPI00029FD6A3|nr:SMC family ATPase [Synechococcus sp. PCC 7502]AFY73700.1 ATPase involved in DNA repair [Synechococcus sp. PCC 7502]
MIPQKLSLTNFLSYQNLALDFSGLHIACICGANGAGKSSLLEAMTWALWGISRANSEDDMIYVGAKEAKVDFVFKAQGQIYRIIRTRPKGSAGSLEFQIKNNEQFKSLTERGLRATQQVIIAHLKMDYSTFVNSAYLRQGRADEFMLKRPSDRKAVLAEMLNLGQYDELSEKAKDITRICKGEITALENARQNLETQITAGAHIDSDLQTLTSELEQVQAQDAVTQQQLVVLQQTQQQRQNWEQRWQWQQQQTQQLNSEIARLQQQVDQQYQQIKNLENLLNHQETITNQYRHYQQLANQEAAYNHKLQQYQKISGDRTHIQQQLAEKKSELNGSLRHYQAQLELIMQQKQDLQNILNKAPEIESVIAQLQQAKIKLQEVEELQIKSVPLYQRRQVLQRTIDREIAQIHAQLDQIQKQQQLLRSQAQPNLIHNLQGLEQQIKILEKKQVYQQRVHEKGLERRDFLNRLKERQLDCEQRIQEQQTKSQQLQQPDTPCPLCDRPLDQAHWQIIAQKHQVLSQELQAELWIIKEQQSASECEIQVLRDEYRHLKEELEQLNPLLQKKGNLEAQLTSHHQAESKLQGLDQDIQALQHKLDRQNFCTDDRNNDQNDAQTELQLIEASLSSLNYDEKNHALARGEVERWRWAEAKVNELKTSRRQWESLSIKIPELQALIQKLAHHLHTNTIDLELQQRLETCDRTLEQINYDPDQHQEIRTQKEQAQPFLLQYQELNLAQQQYPNLLAEFQKNQNLMSDRTVELQRITTEIRSLELSLQETPDPSSQIQDLQGQIINRRSHLDHLIGEIGRLQAAQTQRQYLLNQLQQVTAQISQTQKRQLIHQELQQAFGKNGIQALMIEIILPQIEAEANRILSTLSNYQLNVRFITQKAGKKADKVIDTLEIEIADSRGTRPYETYSGGEVFRINFAIRLALARITAQRMGGTLQTLIIDEGFGTQDSEGCDRLLSAINAIASDFACILVITHMPQLKEAFSTLIEITKTESGSKINLLV